MKKERDHEVAVNEGVGKITFPALMWPVFQELNKSLPNVRSNNISNYAKIVYKTSFSYFPAAVCPQANMQYTTLSSRILHKKIYYSGSEGMVVSRHRVWWTGTARLGWFLQFSINCKNS